MGEELSDGIREMKKLKWKMEAQFDDNVRRRLKGSLKWQYKR